MLKKIFVAVTLLCAVPFSTYAATDTAIQMQIADLLAQLAALEQQLGYTQGSVAQNAADGQEICSIVYGRSLSRGMRGSDVSILQRFLNQQSFLSAEATGFFGSMTQSALTEFQLAYRVITNPSRGGVFGPRTRAYVNDVWCTGIETEQTAAPSLPSPCSNPVQPTLACDGHWEKFYNQEQCHIGWTCVVAQPPVPAINKAPLISAVVGPTLLKPNENGTWNITASDPENDVLLYSVVWGDEGANIATLLNISQQGTPYSSATSVSHSYTNTGAYTIVVFAKDAAGNTVKAALSINVYEAPPPPPPPPPPTPVVKSCTLNGRTFPPGTIIPFSPLLNWPPHAGALPAQALMPVMACAMQCGGQWVRYRCENGDWIKIDTGYPYYPYPFAMKPVIYLYPTTTQEISVQLRYKGQLAYTYPLYDNALEGWKVIAHPDGTLTNLADGREYSYLFWEGKEYPLKVDETRGFVVKGSDTRAFLQTKLAELGLTPREYNEFIVFWLPRMQDNPYNFVQFVGSEYTDSAPLVISPKPDSILRVFMAFKPLDAYKQVIEQDIQPFERNGFTVIEWGGTEL